MNRHTTIVSRLLFGLLICCAAQSLRGQEAASSLPAPENGVQGYDPAVEAVLARQPQTHAEQIRAALILVGLGRPELGKPFVERLAQAKLSEDELADLADDVGSADLMRLARIEQFAPEAGKFVAAALEAADRRSRDPQRLARLVDQLSDPSAEVRFFAIADLEAAKSDAVTFLLKTLAARRKQDDAASLKRAVIAMGPLATGPLMGALESDDPVFKADVIEMLGRLEFGQAAPFLVGPATLSKHAVVRDAASTALRNMFGAAPSRASAARLLESDIDRYLSDSPPPVADHLGMVELWNWDDKARACVRQSAPVADAAVLLAARLTPDLIALRPDNARDRRLDCAVQLEAAKIRNGFDKPLPKGAEHEMCASRGADELQALLTFSIERDLIGAATAAAEILGEIGTAELLVQGDAEPAPLAKALQHPDRRLRFAAAEAIMNINPQRTYPGSSHLPEALGFFAETGGAKRAVVGHPRVPQGHQLAALLSQLGYDAEAATSGRRVFELAKQSADVELVLLYTSLDDPDVRETIYQLRSNAGTARLPIGIVASLKRLAWARDVASEDPRTEAFVRPHDIRSITAQLEGLRGRDGRRAVSAEERSGQATAALRWLGQLSRAPHSIYDLQRQADAVERSLYVPGQTEVAAATLGELNVADGQRVLVDLAASPAMSTVDREAAAAAFARSVQKHGILLTSNEILRQYDRYNASEFADKATQDLLASILDTIEGKKEGKGK